MLYEEFCCKIQNIACTMLARMKIFLKYSRTFGVKLINKVKFLFRF